MSDLTRDEALALVVAYNEAMTRLREAEFARMIVVVDARDEGEQEIHMLKCPYCGAQDSEEIVVIVDEAIRSTSCDEIDASSCTVPFWYNGEAYWEGRYYECIQCSVPVRLPEGWREV